MRKKGILISLLTLIVTLVIGIFISVIELQGKAEENPFEATYALGETLKIPSRNITVDGVSKESVSVVIYPDGSAVSSETIKLSEAGVYKVEYRALINGRVHKENYQFTVDYPMYSVTAKNDNASYQEVTVNGQTEEGLLVKVGNGSTFECNQAIDLTKMEKGENLISLYIVPEAYGAYDCSYLYITLTDVLDESNYVQIKLYRSPTDNRVLYASAKAHNQEKYYGAERGLETEEPITNDWGFAANGSFSGEGFGSDNYAIQLSYDNDTKTVYMNNNYYKNSGNYVIDFNNTAAFTEGWNGFESGKIRISAFASSYAKNSMSFLVTSLAQVDLEKTVLEMKEPSGLTIDFGDYDDTDYPHAVVGKPYRIFDAVPLSVYTSERVAVSVKTSYGSSNAMNVDIKDGKFIPQKAIKHTIVYTVTDGFGNTKDYTVPVTVDSIYTPVNFQVAATEINAGVGSWIEIPQITEMSGGNGKLTAEIVLKNKTTGETVAIKDNKYRFVKQGNFELVYTVKDYNECEKTVEIPIILAPAEKPIFAEAPSLPLMYIKGAKYPVPTIYADDFSSGDIKRVQATAKVYAGAKELTVTDGYFIAEGTEITLKYTAKDNQNRVNTQEYSVVVTDVGFNGTLDLTKYFKAEGGVATTVDKKVEGTWQKLLTLKATETNANFMFIRELNGKNFSTIFALEAGKTGYEKIIFRLMSVEDNRKYIDIALTEDKGKVAVSINDGLAVTTAYQFGGDIKDCTAQLNGNTLFICNEYFTVKTYADGSEFKGFDKFVYLTICLENCSNVAELTLKNINKQSMNNEVGADVTEPNVMFLGARCRGERELNSIITINPVLATDVLDPYAKITFSVRLPSKDYATAVDGTALKNVPADKEYQLKLGDYGSYVFTYTYTDSNENEDVFTTVITCSDKTAPEISVSVEEISGKVGEKLSIPECSVTDNVSQKIKSYIQIITPDAIFITYDKVKGYVPEKAGTYTVRYYVFDENYNAQIKDIVCKVS